MPFDERAALESTVPSIRLTGAGGAFEARLWPGERTHVRLELPDLATLDAIGDRLAVTLLPDLMWAWPILGSGDDHRLLDLAALSGPILGGEEFGGWGWRTWMSHPHATELIPEEEPPEPVTSHEIGGGMVRVDLAPQLSDDEAVLRGHSALTAASAPAASEAVVITTAAAVRARAMPDSRLDSVQAEGVDLRSQDLARSSWERAVLIDCDFDDAILVGASFDESRLDQVSLRRCDLSDASLVAADLVSSFLEDAILDRANLRGATLINCEFARVACRGGTFEAALLEDCRLTDADLTGSSFARATLRRCDLRGTVLVGADLNDTVLEDCLLPDQRP